MELPQPPDAIFASSDPKAFVIMHALHDLGKRIPADVSVLGFDNVAMASMVEPPLSTMAQPFREIGATAAKSVIRQIRYKEEHGVLPPANSYVMAYDLIIRRSTN
jgi:LacI family transcriptional regulator